MSEQYKINKYNLKIPIINEKTDAKIMEEVCVFLNDVIFQESTTEELINSACENAKDLRHLVLNVYAVGLMTQRLRPDIGIKDIKNNEDK